MIKKRKKYRSTEVEKMDTRKGDSLESNTIRYHVNLKSFSGGKNWGNKIKCYELQKWKE